MTKIMNHKAISAIESPSPNHSGRISPRFIVLHYTAGWSAAGAINTFKNRRSRVSAHVTIDQKGLIYQHVPFNVKAWHAGPSQHMGYSGLNSHSIGIEMVNPGYLVKVSGGYRDSVGNIHSEEKVGPVVKQRHPTVGSGDYYWPIYSEALLDSAQDLVESLISNYDILDIVSHEEIDNRGWKTDPGPAFPMKRFTSLLNSRESDYEVYSVTASKLNVRSGPSTRFNVIASVYKKDVFQVQEKSGKWYRISEDGWVHSAYLQRVK